MKHRIIFLLALSSMVLGCQPRTPAMTAAEQRAENLRLAQEEQLKLDEISHRVLCLRVAAGEPSAMMEMLFRRTTCAVE